MHRPCQHCGKAFAIEADDAEYYKNLKVPEPRWCPPCREMRRMAWCNEAILYQGTCALCKKGLVTQYAPSQGLTIYCITCWWSDKWDRLSYGKDVDLSRSILDQIHELEWSVPHCCVNTDIDNENSEYTHHAGHEKNCYMMFHTSFAEDCYYGYGVKKATSCVDNHYCHESELCYECVDVHSCYALAWSQDCINCNSSAFLRDCIGCKSCLLCTGLRNKEFCIANEQLSKKEYEEKKKSLDLGNAQIVQQLIKRFAEIQLKFPRKATHTEMTEDSLGDHLYRARKATNCFDCSDIEFSKYCSQLQLGTKYCYDIYQFGIGIELCCDCAMIGYNCYNCQYCFDILQQCSDLQYCISCLGVKESFGCFGLVQKRNCILNKQYSKEEYDKLRAKIIEKMKADGEYGEFLPMKYSPSSYNETMAVMWYPKDKKTVTTNGWKWEDALPFTTGKETIKSVPDRIDDVPDTITDEILACSACKRNYKITPQELAFYRTQRYPVPKECFFCRRIRRMRMRTPRIFWKRPCAQCRQEIQTTFAPDRPEIVYCESCYQKAIY